jgi:soluble lytic murein transglycosylase
MDAVRAGDWQTAARLAAKDGPVASDVVEWMRLRKGDGSYTEVRAFLERRPDWPGERYLRRQSEQAVIAAGPEAALWFFAQVPPQTPEAVLAYAAALEGAGKAEEARALVIGAWRNMAIGTQTQALFLVRYADVLKPHHDARLDQMLWDGTFENARRMFDLASPASVTVAKARIALRADEKGVDTLIAAVPASHAQDPGLQYERFSWRARKGRSEDAKDLLRSVSVSAAALGQPEAWANRRRSLARDEMRNGNAVRAYEIAARHFLSTGSNYADLEWLAGYIALRKLNEPATALRHFENLDAAVSSPISKGRAGYWRGRALETLGRPAEADQAYAYGAQYQSSFYGLLAAERAGLPFDLEIATEASVGDWRRSELARSSVFEAGLLLQASGEINLAEQFWTHLASTLDRTDASLLVQAAIDAGQPHLAVIIGKEVAGRAIVIPRGYYALHPVADQKLPMDPAMVLAIARRESEFDPRVQSGVGARGLMQVMPATGEAVARQLGRSAGHSTDRMITDPEYNAELGAAYLSMLAGRFRGNVVLMSAGYNAGPGRPDRWVGEYGDPRRAEVDVVDWIENIPFRETQNYVMRVTESLPTYRAMLGRDPLPVPFTEELKGSTLLPFAPKGE